MADDDSNLAPTTAATYLVVFEVSPAAMFGVPQPGMTVLNGPGHYEGDVFHRATGRRVGLGAMSQYRPADEAVSMDFGLLGHSCHLSDNFLHVSVEAHTHGEALATAQRTVGLLTLYLSLLVGRYCGAEPVLIQSADGDDRTPPPPGTLLSRVTMYNLVELTERISAAIAATGITDERLLVGMRYLRHAFWLNEQTVTMHDDPENAHADLVMLLAPVQGSDRSCW